MIVVVEGSRKRVGREAERCVGLQQVKTADEVDAEKDEGSDEEVSTFAHIWERLMSEAYLNGTLRPSRP